MNVHYNGSDVGALNAAVLRENKETKVREKVGEVVRPRPNTHHKKPQYAAAI